jgi:hypothetical protein
MRTFIVEGDYHLDPRKAQKLGWTDWQLVLLTNIDTPGGEWRLYMALPRSPEYSVRAERVEYRKVEPPPVEPYPSLTQDRV